MWYHLDIFQKPKSKQIIHWYICTLYLWQGSVGFLIIFCLTFVALLNLKTTWLSPLGYVLLPMFLCSYKQILWGGGGILESACLKTNFFFGRINLENFCIESKTSSELKAQLSYSDHFISGIRPSVCPYIVNFKHTGL